MNEKKKLENQCAHSPFCIRMKQDNLKYCSVKDKEECEIARKYDNYGEAYNSLGVG